VSELIAMRLGPRFRATCAPFCYCTSGLRDTEPASLGALSACVTINIAP
jgi:hypothetical protein